MWGKHDKAMPKMWRKYYQPRPKTWKKHYQHRPNTCGENINAGLKHVEKTLPTQA